MTTPDEPGLGPDPEADDELRPTPAPIVEASRSRGPGYWIGGVVVIAVVAIVLILVFRSDDDTPDDTSTPATLAKRAKDETAGQQDEAPPAEPEVLPDVDENAGKDAPTPELSVEREPEASEKASRFYGRLAESLSSGDLDFALARLDPAMKKLYGNGCKATLQRLSDPTFDITFHKVKRTEPWVFQSDAGSVDIDVSVVTSIALHGPGQDGTRSESHLTVLDGKYHWFTYC